MRFDSSAKPSCSQRPAFGSTWVVLCCMIPFLSAIGALAQVECSAEGGRVGVDRGYPIRAAVAAVPAEGLTGRESIRYMVRFSERCLRQMRLGYIDTVSLRLANEHFLAGSSCRPISAGRRAKVLWGEVLQSAEDWNMSFSELAVELPTPPVWTRALPTSDRHFLGFRLAGKRRAKNPFRDPSTALEGGWVDLPLGRQVPVRAGYDLMVGVEIVQEPWECPLMYAERKKGRQGGSGSYLQMGRFELEAENGARSWAGFDCNANGQEDHAEGYYFRVDDAAPLLRCGLTALGSDLDWTIRVQGGASGKGWNPSAQSDKWIQLATDKKVKTYHIDTLENVVQVYSPLGRLEQSIEVQSPISLSLGSDGRLYVLAEGRVAIYSRWPHQLIQQRWLGNPSSIPMGGLVVKDEGSWVYVGDPERGRILALSWKGLRKEARVERQLVPYVLQLGKRSEVVFTNASGVTRGLKRRDFR